MHVLIPVKSLTNSKTRLASLLSVDQRARLSKYMLEDMLECLNSVKEINSINIVSCESSLEAMANSYKVNFIHTEEDKGYSEDALFGIEHLRIDNEQTVAIIPADIPHLSPGDLRTLIRQHKTGLSLCPAVADSGTNALVFNVPLNIPLLFGNDSLSRYQSVAFKRKIPLQLIEIGGFAKDIDRPADLNWLKEKSSGARTWNFLQNLDLTDN
ncbi:MAG: 2-phospho-L-lactate guanylyltransferase [Gammaproteobacteria bacterium]|nr:2-phospho-L-lactate guanylyltransferase [Gammaproteobacteria bacterium]